MNNEVMPFDFKGSQVRTVSINDEAWFVGVDVANVLGYTNKTKAVINHVEEDDLKQTKIPQSQNGTLVSKVNLINISGVFSLILSSKLPSAKQFRHWVTYEVLPEIGRTGAYQPSKSNSIEQLRLATQSVFELDDRVTNLEDNQYLNPGEYAYLGRLISKKVYEYIDVHHKEFSKKQIGKLFKDINSGIKQITNVSTRSQLRNKDFKKVEEYLSEWTPTKATLMIIKEMKEGVTE